MRSFLVLILLTARVVAEPPGRYGEVSVGIGYLASHESFDNGQESSDSGSVVNPRWSAGLEFRRGPAVLHLGGVLDAFLASSNGAAYGLETSIGRREPTFGYDFRVSVESGHGDSSPQTGEGAVAMVGARVHNHYGMLGADAVYVRNDQGTASGVIVSAGLVERPGGYALATSAGLALIGGVALLVLLSGQSTH